MTDETRAQTPYPKVDPRPDVPAVEERVLAHWKEEGIFEASVEGRPGGGNAGTATGCPRRWRPRRSSGSRAA